MLMLHTHAGNNLCFFCTFFIHRRLPPTAGSQQFLHGAGAAYFGFQGLLCTNNSLRLQSTKTKPSNRSTWEIWSILDKDQWGSSTPVQRLENGLQ